MAVVLSRDGRALRFTDERWEHIVRRHPLLATERDRLIETLRQPDRVQRGDGAEVLSIRRFEGPPFNGQHPVVAYIIEEGSHGGFIVTACSARRLTASRRTVWTR